MTHPKSTATEKPGAAVAVQRLRRLHLGEREVVSIRRVELAQQYGMTERSLSRLFGVPKRAHWIGFVTPLGIESLRDRAPEFCAWVEREAFPAVFGWIGNELHDVRLALEPIHKALVEV